MIKHEIPTVEYLRAVYETLDKSQLIEMLIQNNLHYGIGAKRCSCFPKDDEGYMMESHKTWYDGQPIDRTPIVAGDSTPIIINATFEMPPIPPQTEPKVY